jgi:hypothetical protein
MKCEECREAFPDFLTGEAEPEEVQEHLKGCVRCQEELDSLQELWTELGKLPDAATSPAMSRRFHHWLDQEEERLHRGWFRRFLPQSTPLPQLGWTAAALLLGVILGLQLPGRRGDDQVRQLRAELDSVNRAVALSLLRHQSASERLKAVSFSLKAHRDDEIAGALLETLAYDPNVNVRLAAVDALAQMADRPLVRSGLAEALPEQSSPAVQVALAELLLEVNGKASEAAVKNLLARDTVDPAVQSALREAMKVEL